MRPITDILRDIRQGRVVDYATAKMAELMQSIQATGKSGSITIVLKLKPETDNNGVVDRVEIESDVKVSAPKASLPKGAFFVSRENDLLRDDPRQREMFSAADRGDVALKKMEA